MNEIEKNSRIVATVSRQLQIEFDIKGLDEKNVRKMMQLDKAGIKVAQYLTEMPPRHVLMQQIQKSLEAAKARFANFIEEKESGRE